MSNRIVQLPPIESFGHLTPDKWLLLKTEEIRAACLAIMPYVMAQPSRQVFDFLTKATGAYPGQEIVRKVIEAMQRKATEE